MALTSDPIKVGGHAIAETIEIPLPFSKAATVVGMPTITSGTTGTERTGEHSGAGRAPDELQFSHTVATGDQDTDGIAVATNSLVLNGGTIRASAASGALSHGAVQAGDHNMDRAAPTLAPNDVTPVTVQFSQNVYLVAETDDPSTPGPPENKVEVTVTLSADPERTVVIPIVTTNEGPITSNDYSGVPQSVTFNSGDTDFTFTFTANPSAEEHDSESVRAVLRHNLAPRGHGGDAGRNEGQDPRL